MALQTPRVMPLKNLSQKLVLQFGDSCALKIMELLVLEITPDFVRHGGLNGDYGNGLLIFAKRLQWTSTARALSVGYCWQLVVEQIPTFDNSQSRPLMVWHPLECSQFLDQWNLPHDAASSPPGTYGMLWGFEFSDPITEETNPLFPEDDGAEIADACGFNIRCMDKCNTAEQFPDLHLQNGSCRRILSFPWSRNLPP